MSVALPGRMFGPEFRRRGYAPVVLARTLGDAGVVTSALIPWNSCGAYIAATLAIPTFSFAGFAFFCLFAPLMTVAIGARPSHAQGRPVEQPTSPIDGHGLTPPLRV